MKIIFMGTPEFALPSLKALIDNGYSVCLVVTQPDKPSGRGNKLSAPPVKEFALTKGIEVYQPEKVKNQEFTDKLASYNADIIVTVAYGKILLGSALRAARLGCINVHASLLPKYRGAAPLWWVIINGEKKTGITTMYTDEGMDTGNMLEVSEYEIGKDMTVGELSYEMSELGAKTLLTTLEKLKNGTLVRKEQNHDDATYAPMISKSTGHIDFKKFAREIHNLVRGTNPWPAAYTFYEGQRMKVFKTEYDEVTNISGEENNCAGTIIEVTDEGIFVVTGKGVIIIKEIQVDSSKKMAVKEYIKGHKIEKGKILGG